MTFGDKIVIVARLAWAFARTMWSTLLILALSVLFTLGTIQICTWLIERHVPLWAFVVGSTILLCVGLTASFVIYSLWKHGWDYFAGPKPDDQTPTDGPPDARGRT